MRRTRAAVPRGGAAPEPPASWAAELRNALAFAVLAGAYALMFGVLFYPVKPAPPTALLAAFGLAYALAVVISIGAQAAVGVILALLPPARGAAVMSLAAPLASLVACAAVLPRLFRPADLAQFLGTAAFLGAGIALSGSQHFYARLQQQLALPRRVRAFLDRRPTVSRWLLRWIGPLLRLGPLVPWVTGALVVLLLPAPLRARAGPYVLILAYLTHHFNHLLLEELAVWVFLHALRQGDYVAAAWLPIRPARLAAEIAAAPPDLGAPFALFIASGIDGLDGVALEPEALSRLVPAHLAAYGLAAGERSLPVGSQAMPGEHAAGPPLRRRDQPPGVGPGSRPAASSLIRRLLERGIRFQIETGVPQVEAPEPLPAWSELFRRTGRERLQARYPGEALGRIVARRYESAIRGLLLPLGILWLPLLGLTLFLADGSVWPIPLIGAALSFGLLLWVTLFYANWICEESLRRRDFAFLAHQLGGGLMRGELEDALGSRDALVRERAVELLLFDDDLARLGFTVPPAGLRKYLKRAP